MNIEGKEEILKELWRLRGKADQTRSFHSIIAENLRCWNKVTTIYVTIGSAVGTTVIFSKIPDEYFLLFGIFSASVFIVSLLPTALNFNKFIEHHVNAVNLLTNWIRDAENFGNYEILTLSAGQMQIRQKELVDLYKNISQKNPAIDNKKFLTLKQKHLQKIAISKELDKNAFESI
ncbi:hypothetical protein LC612_39205, partial [Nostoc sp. CHAB 5834]|nr:hypothetical protein [Nostoc sp. CHAB 5834]